MNRKPVFVLATAALAALMASACHRAPPPAAAAHADGIAWFAGDVPAAFAAAKASGKPVFLYWGAEWCPPCLQLKASVLTRPDFIAQSRLFVPVYLDGDAEGAQKWGDEFGVGAYPTVVILTPDRVEITRLTGGLDLRRYAEVLDNALADTQPAGVLLARMDEAGATLTADDCRRLAYNDWQLDLEPKTVAEVQAARLMTAAQRCPQALANERARLTIAAAGFVPSAEAVRAIARIVHDPASGAAVSDSLVWMGEPFYAAVKAQGAGFAAAFLTDWSTLMRTTAQSPTLAGGDRLAALGGELRATKALRPDGRIPDPLAALARERVVATLASKHDAYARAGIVNSASWIYDTLGDTQAEYDMLERELATANTPYYYMADLGALDEALGRKQDAIAWYARSYAESKGAATRFQWGEQYLEALLRLAPEDAATIREAGLAVLGELDGADRIHARTRARLGRLGTALRAWNANDRHAAVIEALRRRVESVCGRQSSDEARESCTAFLG